MNTFAGLLAQAAAALGLGLGGPALHAQAILIGQTAGFSGPVAAGVKETTDGARLYLNRINAQGGVNGRVIELISLDDKFEPALALENATKLVKEKGVIALFLTRGTPHAEALLPLLAEARVPLVAPSTGAMLLHQPVNPWVFNVRATYQREAEKAVTHLATLGMTRIGVVQANDSFGSDAAAGAAKGFDKAQLKPVFNEKIDRSKPDFSALAALLGKADAQAIVFIASGQTVADGAKVIRAAGSRAQIVTLSNNASSGFIKAMGEMARGTVVTQVFPAERAVAVPLVKQLTELAAAKQITEISPAMLEGYAAAKVLVEGLKRAGATPTGLRLARGLESLNRFNLGGLELSYSATDHTGLDYADLAIIDADGKFKRCS